MPGKKFLTSLSFWQLNLAAWLAVGIACFLAKVYFYPNLHSGLTLLLVNLILAVVLSSLLRLIYRQIKLVDFFEIKTLGIVMLGSVLVAFLQAGIAQAMVNHLQWGHPELPRSLALSYRIEFTWLLFLCWSLGYYGLKAKATAYRALQRSRQDRLKTRNMELQLLRNRIDPHFLFNSLNGIAAEIAPHPDTASELLNDVSDYLRYLLDHRDQSSSPLSEELDAMTSYLKMEQSRFGDRLRTEIRATRQARRICVPCFLLQPLVENAVKHALWPDAAPLEISIRATAEQETLTIHVLNTGTLREGSQDGVGLSTLRRLLEIQYPARHEFTLSNDHDKVMATLILQGTPCSES